MTDEWVSRYVSLFVAWPRYTFVIRRQVRATLQPHRTRLIITIVHTRRVRPTCHPPHLLHTSSPSSVPSLWIYPSAESFIIETERACVSLSVYPPPGDHCPFHFVTFASRHHHGGRFVVTIPLVHATIQSTTTACSALPGGKHVAKIVSVRNVNNGDAPHTDPASSVHTHTHTRKYPTLSPQHGGPGRFWRGHFDVG